MVDSSDIPTILIVDDDVRNLQALEHMLERPGRMVMKATSGDEALRCLLLHDVAVMLLDIRMAEMDGYETAALIRTREKTQALPIIFLTAFNKDDADVLKGYSFGAVDYIFKPIVPEILCAKVDIFVELYKRTKALVRKNEDLERAEHTLLHTNQELAELNRLKSSFVSVASHEIRTPVTGIKGYVENMLSGLTGPLTEKQRHYLARVTSNVDRLMRIIDELLDIARIEAGQIQLQLDSVNVSQLISDVIEELQPLAVQKQISFQHDTSHVSDVHVKGDEGKLHQVLTNLVHNALKFTPSGGRVDVGAVTREPGKIQISVRDTGPGIPASDLPKIFDRFYSGPSVPPDTRGAGLGLAISKSLIALHGGHLSVSSTAGQGSHFFIDLPAT
ncbi:MAG: hybrid sensor histidine kinase/response regulator [Nitrospirota bacterium]|nr:hybrid sensor histidine kinase/response regulator [Nitrospirota bacterium]